VIFKRRRNRLLDLTPVGKQVLNYAQRALVEIENIRSVSSNSEDAASGSIVIACTLVQSRYVLPSVIDRFMKRYPNARLEFFQGPRQHVFAKVEAGDADIGIGGDRGVSIHNVAMLNYGTLHYAIVAKPGHPLLRISKPTLRDVASYPLITHMFEPDGQWKLADVFKKEGLSPNIVFHAADADVSKAYAELGIGVAVLSSISFDKKRDRMLRAINVDHLFAPEPLFIGFHRKRHISRHLMDLIKMLVPGLSTADIERAAGR
jgi:LysR family cys regulon transcriptional activator